MNGVARIAAERRRQVEEEGWTPEHDDQHGDGELAQTAAYYCMASIKKAWANLMLYPRSWHPRWRKREGYPYPSDRDLVKAGALIAAELDRRMRSREPEARHG